MVLICCIVAITSHAQHKITGKIIDEATLSPLEIANVVLSTADSLYVVGTTTNLEGVFEITGISPGDYLLTTSYLGFTSRIILLGLSKSVDLGEIPMREEASLLEAVTVTGSTTTRKADRMVVFVTDNQKKISSNGLNILQGMKLPRLSVNPVSHEVSLPGDEVLRFCINGVRVEPSDVRALQPGEIIRIEYLDNPGLRYGNADAVINYILKRETSGGAVSMDLGNAVTTSFGDDQLSAKFNYKKSEFGLGYNIHYRKPTETWFDREQTFHFEDGTSFTRYDEGMPGDFKEIFHKLNLNYNLLDDKRFFNATLRYEHGEANNIDLANQYNSLHPENITQVSQGNDVVKNTPVLDLYYARFLPRSQTLILNVVGTYIGSDLLSKYEETRDGQPITDILSDVSGKKYSVIGEGIYEKIFENSNRFTAGMKHTQGYTNNEYTGKVSTTTKMKQAETYAYAEYYGKINKYSYTGGLGVSRSWAEQDGKDEYTHYTFRPKITFQYDFTPATSLRLSGEISSIPPSLSELSAVDQYVDTIG